ncbi:MAG: ribonuclease P protein component [Candidatus Omnitrophica bacterium]|nr:ribonuclease P protein component [Candidatus Omnitrophota bacterium]
MSNYIKSVRKTAEFKEVFSRGKKIKGNLFSLFYLDSHQTETFDLGIVTRKKLSKNATQRNYLKRIIK